MAGATPLQKPFPTARAEMEIEAEIEDDAFALIQAGFTPRSDADKWLIEMDADQWLRIYRTATGSCIFIAHFTPAAAGYTIDEAWVNRSPAEYLSRDTAYDARLFVYLLRRLLLKHQVPFPQPASLPHQNKAVHENHVMGMQADGHDSFIPLDQVE